MANKDGSVVDEHIRRTKQYQTMIIPAEKGIVKIGQSMTWGMTIRAQNNIDPWHEDFF